MTHTMTWTCRMVVAMGIALFGSGQARAVNGAEITNEIQKWCNLYDTTWNTKGPVAVANTFFADDAVFVYCLTGQSYEARSPSQKSGAIFTKNQRSINALFRVSCRGRRRMVFR